MARAKMLSIPTNHTTPAYLQDADSRALSKIDEVKNNPDETPEPNTIITQLLYKYLVTQYPKYMIHSPFAEEKAFLIKYTTFLKIPKSLFCLFQAQRCRPISCPRLSIPAAYS